MVIIYTKGTEHVQDDLVVGAILVSQLGPD